MEIIQPITATHSPPDDDLLRHWSLTIDDLRFVSSASTLPSLRVWLGLQLCFLRKHGLLARHEPDFPPKSIPWMNRQFSVPPHADLEPPQRPATWASQREALLSYTCWVDFDVENPKFIGFVSEIVQSGKSRSEILAAVPAFLQSAKIVPPGSRSELERHLGSLIEKVSADFEKRVFALLPKTLLSQLGQMTVGKFPEYPDLFNDLRSLAPFPSRNQFYRLVNLEKCIRPLALASKSVTQLLSPKLIGEYAESARRWSLWEIKRFCAEKRGIVLACFIIDSHASLLDNLVQMFDRLVTRMENRVAASWDDFIIKKRQINLENRRIILRAADIFARSEPDKLVQAHRTFDLVALRKALEDRSARGDGDDEDKGTIMGRMGQKFRSILQHFLSLEPQVAKGQDKLEKALEIARSAIGHFISQKEPHFIEHRYRSCAANADGDWRRDLWEWFLIQEIRTRLRAQDIYFPNSIRHKGFWNSLVNTSPSIVISESNTISAVDDLKRDFEREFKLFQDSLPNNQFVKIVDGSIQLSRDRAEPDPVPDSLRAKLLTMLGRTRIEDLFREVDIKTNFSSAFRHHASGESLPQQRRHVLHAALIAHATNLGLAGMASAAEGITADMLEDISRGYLSQENINEAIRIVVDYQASLEAGDVHGRGDLSSSDGQLFAVRGKSLLVEYHPRRFGWLKRGINVYSHISDRYTVFSSQVLSCSVREWVAVLDGLLGNDTSLHPRIHTTDTHGYTDHMFALSWLLGFMFAPRIRDVGGTRLWLPEGVNVGDLGSIFQSRRASLQGFKENWDLSQRVVSAMKQKLVDGRTVCMRLANSSGDPLANALLDAGRIIKSTFLLRWMRDPDFRRPLNAQLNKGEARQDLARSTNFASGAGLRSADPIDLMHRTSVLALACNIIVAWNTHSIGVLLDQMKDEDIIQKDLNLSSVSPLMHEHIIRTGTYRFRQQETQDGYPN